jgi:alpha-beta hydrolase superfamily lysophospholipase
VSRAPTRTVEGHFTGAGAVSLRWVAWQPDGAVRCALLLVHGLSDHADRYAGVGARLAADGIATYAFDLRGHGRSPGSRGHAPSFHVLLEDVERFRHFVRGRIGASTPLFVLGHSMGGLIAIRYVQEADRGLHGVILSAPWLATASPVPFWKRIPAALLERIMPSLPVPAGIDPAAISDDPAAVRAYRDDPHVHGRISPRLFREAERAAALARAADRLHVPAALVLLPADDRIVDPATTRAFAAALRDTDVTLREWAPAGHELFGSTKRDLVLDVLREWILARSDER